MKAVRPLHIGFLTMEYPHGTIANSGGLGTSIRHLALALAEKGLKVSVIIANQDNNDVIDDNGVLLYKIKARKFKFLSWYLSRRFINNRVNEICKANEISVLEAPDWTGLTAFMRFNIPLVIRFHGSDTYFCHLEKRPQKWKNRFLEKRAMSVASAFIAPTDFAGQLTQQLFSLDPKKIRTIHYGLTLKNFSNKEPSQFDANTILYIGTLIRKKGILDLAEIFNKVVEQNPDAKLLLVGADSSDIITGSKSTYFLFKKLLSDTALDRTNYLGKVPYKDVQNFIKKAHVCVFPSYAETLGMVTIESMALKKPVVNTSIGWAQSLIDDSINGFLVYPSEHEVYANRILELLNDNQKCLEIGEAARLKVEEEFDMAIQVGKNLEFYQELLG